MLKAIDSYFKAYRDRWLARRLPPATQVTLNQQRIFIIPSRSGLLLLAMAALLFVLAMNFQNSLIYGVCFWLLALLVINILYTYRNLSGLILTASPIAPCFAGENAELEIELSSHKQRKFALLLGWPEQSWLQADLDSSLVDRIKLNYPVTERGYCKLPAIKVQTSYPTGWVVAWSYVNFELQALVYPAACKPQALLQNQSSPHQDQQEQNAVTFQGTEDFQGLRSYQTGDSLARIHWLRYAQTGQLYTREFVDYEDRQYWLDWNQFPHVDTERRLSYLCYQVLVCHEQGLRYGLRLPSRVIAPDNGVVHYQHCLRCLALYGFDDAQ